MRKTQHFITFFCILLSVTTLHSQVVINEFQASNASTIPDPDSGEYNDWLELYNGGNNAIDLSGWYLSDSDNSTEWPFPTGTIINAKGFLLIWADGTDHDLHTSFKLGADGEPLSLFNPGGNKINEILFTGQTTDVSYGRKTDGGTELGYFNQPTPGASNETSVFYTGIVAQVPVFSQPGGFYTEPLTLSISDKYGTGTLRFTIDGAVPTESSPVFSQPIQIDGTTVVKARMFYADQLPGPVVTNTYFINEHFEQRGLPVMSLSTDPKYFFAPDSGLYVQDFKPTWERPIHLEFYEPDGLLGFHHDAGVQLGGENAWILPQKLLNIYSRKQYGSGHFDYQLFPDNPRNQFGDIILRCSGSDWSYTLFRDGLMQELIKQQADLDGQDFRPCLLYINGQYFGIHNIREKQDAEYIEHYHGIDPDSLDYIENNAEIKEGDAIAYQQMVSILTTGVQSDENFSALDSVADTKNFMDYIISQIYVANTSWGHNIALFRKRSADGRWRWLMHDYDRGFNLANVNGIGMNWWTTTTGTEGSNPAWGTLFLRKMLQNEKFKQQFITRFADHLYVTYNPAAINKRVDIHAGWIRNEMPNQVARWLGTTSTYGDAIPSVEFWENEVNNLKLFGQQRTPYMLDNLSSFFGLDGSTELDLDVDDRKRGTIQFNDMNIPSYPWTGNFIRNRTFTLTAKAKQGFEFYRWEKIIGTESILLPAGSTWKYSDATTPPPVDWNTIEFNDASWSSGTAELGYGDGDELTTLSYGPNANNKTPSYYFRTAFSISDLNAITKIFARIKADDGAVVYINGNEVLRVNMPPEPAEITFGTFAVNSVSGTEENTWKEIRITNEDLQFGENIIAVEIHQSDPASSDISFDFELKGVLSSQPEIVSTNAKLEVSLDENPASFVAHFKSNGDCGILPDTIFNTVTLIASCSPYVATGNVVVMPEGSLIANPGVEIQFPEKAGLWVSGEIDLRGTEENPVLVTNTPAGDSWGGIFLKNTTSQANQLDYVKLKNATASIQRFYFPAAISAYNSDIILDHLDLMEVKDNPIYARFSNVTLTNSKIRSTVTGDGINVKQGFAHVENCEFTGGFQPDMDAIDYDGVIGGMVRNNIIHDFRGDNCDGLDIGEECENLLIEDNFIYNCFDKGISVGQQSTATIRNNVIAYTNIGIALKDESHADIEHSTLFGNQHGISAYEKNPGNLGGTGSIKDCIVSNASVDAYVYDTYSGLTILNCLSDLDSISTPGTLNTDPLFENPTWYDFRLKANSPANNIGTSGTDLGATSLPAYHGQPQVMFSEILYNDSLTNPGEFLELYNPGNVLVDLSGYIISAAVEFTFPTGAVIAPQESVIIAKSAINFQGSAFQVFEWTDGKLKNEGEVIYLFDRDGLLIDFVRYNNHAPWPESSALLGRSLELVSSDLDNHFATSWKLSEQPGGSPGEVNGITGTHDVENNLSLLVYPNPADKLLHVLGKFEGNEEFSLFNINGRLISHGFLSGDIHLDQIPDGMYVLKVENGKEINVSKVIVTH